MEEAKWLEQNTVFVIEEPDFSRRMRLSRRNVRGILRRSTEGFGIGNTWSMPTAMIEEDGCFRSDGSETGKKKNQRYRLMI